MSYSPLYISGVETGLVQSRQEFILPNDAYPTLENAFVWRERIKRKRGYELLGRLQRSVSGALGNTGGLGNISRNLITVFSLEATAQIVPGSVVAIVGGTITYTDNGQGVLVSSGIGTGTINYATTDISISGSTAITAVTVTFQYYPMLPVMGLRERELNAINFEDTIAFDTVYAYRFQAGAWQEFIPGTVWSGTNSEFFWSTNYWVTDGNVKAFWVTNDAANLADPIRYTNGVAWANFAPTINAAGDVLGQALVMLPFRGRMVVGNTREGQTLATSTPYSNRIRWAAIGTPFSDVSPIVSTVSVNAWRDDIRGKGGYLDIPTSESIISFGFVRDNLVVFCERSTWQLRYTGRSIAPFQIERVNSELGSESTFSSVQFDTSLVGVGDKGIVECDSFKSIRIDIKIPDLVFAFNNKNAGPERVHGIRDFIQKLAYWTYPFEPEEAPYEITFPNRRLVYNYENDSWAIFTDSLTTLGTFQPQSSLQWKDFPGPSASNKWQALTFPWLSRQALQPDIIGGNQQGFVLYLDSQATNDNSLAITGTGIIGGGATTRIISKDHNLETNDVIQIELLAADPFFADLNNGIYGLDVIDANQFDIYTYNPDTEEFDIPVVTANNTYIGGGKIYIRDGFSIISKKFNFLDDAQNIQMGFVDVLFDNSTLGAVTLNVYLDYNDSTPINRVPENNEPDAIQATPDPFFNSVVPTSQNGGITSSKNWQRVFCSARGNFITLEWTLSNAQLVGPEQESDVQIDAQILFIRRAGRQLPNGV